MEVHNSFPESYTPLQPHFCVALPHSNVALRPPLKAGEVLAVPSPQNLLPGTLQRSRKTTQHAVPLLYSNYDPIHKQARRLCRWLC